MEHQTRGNGNKSKQDIISANLTAFQEHTSVDREVVYREEVLRCKLRRLNFDALIATSFLVCYGSRYVEYEINDPTVVDSLCYMVESTS